jgi:hypothetical protein
MFVKQQEAKSIKAKVVSPLILGIFIVVFDYERLFYFYIILLLKNDYASA